MVTKANAVVRRCEKVDASGDGRVPWQAFEAALIGAEIYLRLDELSLIKRALVEQEGDEDEDGRSGGYVAYPSVAFKLRSLVEGGHVMPPPPPPSSSATRAGAGLSRHAAGLVPTPGANGDGFSLPPPPGPPPRELVAESPPGWGPPRARKLVSPEEASRLVAGGGGGGWAGVQSERVRPSEKHHGPFEGWVEVQEEEKQGVAEENDGGDAAGASPSQEHMSVVGRARGGVVLAFANEPPTAGVRPSRGEKPWARKTRPANRASAESAATVNGQVTTTTSSRSAPLTLSHDNSTVASAAPSLQASTAEAPPRQRTSGSGRHVSTSSDDFRASMRLSKEARGGSGNGGGLVASSIDEAAAAVVAAQAARATRRWRQRRAAALETLSVERHALLAGLFRQADQEEKTSAAGGGEGGGQHRASSSSTGRLGVYGLAALLRSPTLDLGLNTGESNGEAGGEDGAWRLASELLGPDREATLDFSQLVRAVAARAKETVERGEAGSGGGYRSGNGNSSGSSRHSYYNGSGERDSALPVPEEQHENSVSEARAKALVAHLQGTVLEIKKGHDIRSLGVTVRRAFNRRNLGPNDTATDDQQSGKCYTGTCQMFE